MRLLVIVKDLEGKIKVAQFGCIRAYDESTSATELEEATIHQFLSFVNNKHSVETLCKVLPYISFFNKEDSCVYNILMSNKKSDKDYYLRWLDDSIGIEILNNLLECNHDIKLIDYSKYYNDCLFSDICFEINYKTNLYKIRVNRARHKSLEGVLNI